MRRRGEQAVIHLEDAARDVLVLWAAGWLDVRTVTGASDVEQEWHRLVAGPTGTSPLSGSVASLSD